MAFTTAATEKVRITTDGHVLIGHTTPIGVLSGGGTQSLQLHGTAGNSPNARIGLFDWQNNAVASTIYFAKSRSAAIGSYTIVQDGDEIMRLDAIASDGVDFHSRVGIITIAIDGTPGADDTPGRIQFYTTNDGSQAATEKMRITSAGNVGIGTTAPSAELEVNGVIEANSFNYSTTAIDTGKKWIDGRTVWRVVKTGTFTSAGLTNVAIGATPDEVISITGSVEMGGYKVPINHDLNQAGGYTVDVNVLGSNIEVRIGATWASYTSNSMPYYLIVEYTVA